MKKLLPLLFLLACGASSAQQAYIYCDAAHQVPCNTTTPYLGNSGDAWWLAFGKINANFTQLFNGGGSMTWPAAAGIAVYGGSSAWTASISTLAGLDSVLGVTLPSVVSTPTTGHCAEWASATTLEDAGAACGAGGGGNVSNSGTPTNGQIAEWVTATTIQGYSLGTGVNAALGVNVGSAGSVVVNGGALGTPSSGVGTNITNVNAATLGGATFASPGAIGGTTAAAGSFTTVHATGQVTSTVTTGTAPLVIASTTQVANLNAASVGGFTLPCTIPTLVSGDYLTNNGSTCSWSAVSGSGTVTDGAGTTTAGELLLSTTTAHTYSVSASLPAGSISMPNRTVTTSPTVLSSDMGGSVFMNVSGGGTLTIPAIGAGVFGTNQTLYVVNYSASTAAISTTPTINSGGGCVSGTGIPAGDTWQIVSNGTTLDCAQTISSGGGGSGTVTTTGSPASGQLAVMSGATSITSTANAAISAGALSLGASGTVGSIALGNATSGAVTINTVTGALGSVTASFPANTGTVAELNLAQGWTAAQTISGIIDNFNPDLSQAAFLVNGTLRTGGTGTTTIPMEQLQPSGATGATTWSTAGTFIGVNSATGFTGNFLDLYVNGGSSVFSVNYQGNVTGGTYNGTTIPASASLAALGTANTWAAAQTFPGSDILIKGSSTGTTALASANASATNYTATFPAATDTVVELAATQTLTNKSIAASEVNSGTLAAAQMPALTGDVTSTSGAVATTVVKVNGAAVPTSAVALASNGSNQLVAATTVTYLIDTGTTFTGTTGTGACATVSTPTGGTANGRITCTGTSGAATITLTLPTSSTGWDCSANDKTTTADTLVPGADTTTSFTFSAAAIVSGDVIRFMCTGS